ncbi:MAG TPA: glycosyltransferase family 4 protein, partial [Steroidobacteraceae bacterium]
MRLMFLTGSLAYGGAERHAITLANRLAERGHECQLAWVKGDSAQLGRLHLASPGSAFCLDAARYLDLRAVRRLAGALARHRPQVLVAANPYALLYASLARAAARVRVPLILIYHSTRWPGLKEQAKLLAYRPFMWAAARAVFVCDHQRRYCTRRALLSPSNTVIHNGVDTDYFQDHWNAPERRALRAALGYTDTDYVIGSAAALRPEKNHVQLVEATAGLRGAGLGAKALLIGDGPTRAAVEGRARARGVERDVTVTGFREDVRSYLAACDVVCVCSLTEALSLAAIEAMAMGKPLVHSEVGGARELVDPGSNGLLFPAGDTAALVQCLARLADPATRESMGRCARAKAETDFGEERMIDRYEHLLLGVCDATRAGPARSGSRASPAVPRPVVFLLGPRRDALSGVSTHLSLLLRSSLAEEFTLVHFEVGSEGRS